MLGRADAPEPLGNLLRCLLAEMNLADSKALLQRLHRFMVPRAGSSEKSLSITMRSVKERTQEQDYPEHSEDLLNTSHTN